MDNNNTDEETSIIFPYVPPYFPPHYVRWWLIKTTNMLLRSPNYPLHRFDKSNMPVPPTYSIPSSWYSQPYTFLPFPESELIPSTSDTFVPEKERRVDCFFLHPTSFWGPQWNQEIEESLWSPGDQTEESKSSVEITKYWTQATQASAFNETCRIWSPKYRQCTIVGLDNESAMGVAYSDCERAFHYFLQHIEPNAPFVLASHSQGSYHMGMMLEKIIDKNPALVNRMICCYLVGGRYPLKAFGTRLQHIRPGTSPTQLRCVVGWDTVAKDINFATQAMIPPFETLQVNPVTWDMTTDEISGTDSRWKGGITTVMEKNGVRIKTPNWNDFFANTTTNIKTVGLVDANIPREEFSLQRNSITGIVVPTIAREHLGPCADCYWLLQGWYHCEDFGLFWYNVRTNVKERVDEYFNQQSSKL
jgi:hypothetical protein